MHNFEYIFVSTEIGKETRGIKKLFRAWIVMDLPESMFS